MGFSAAWIAVQTIDPAEVLKRLYLEATDEREEFPESDWVAGPIAGGWYLVNSHTWDPRIVDEHELAALSQGGIVVAGTVEEHVMASSAAEYVNGERVWSARYVADGRGLDALELHGKVPDELATIRAEFEAKWGADPQVDWTFSIPPELARARTGYIYDESPVDGELTLHTLRDLRPPSFFARLKRFFGGP